MELSTGTVTVQQLKNTGPTIPEHPNSVNFEVKYPENYTGPRNTPEGISVISKEAAEVFTNRGIGKIVTPVTEEKIPDSNQSNDADKNEEEHSGLADYSKLTVPELKDLLTSKGIEFAPNAKKPDLVALLGVPAVTD